MRLRKEFSLMKEDVSYIKEQIGKLTDETIKKAKAYDELKKYLKHIKLDVKSANITFDTDEICYCIQINYHMPPVKIHIDRENNIERNETFIAINNLNLISLDDMIKISQKIEDIKKMNNK